MLRGPNVDMVVIVLLASILLMTMIVVVEEMVMKSSTLVSWISFSFSISNMSVNTITKIAQRSVFFPITTMVRIPSFATRLGVRLSLMLR